MLIYPILRYQYWLHTSPVWPLRYFPKMKGLIRILSFTYPTNSSEPETSVFSHPATNQLPTDQMLQVHVGTNSLSENAMGSVNFWIVAVGRIELPTSRLCNPGELPLLYAAKKVVVLPGFDLFSRCRVFVKQTWLTLRCPPVVNWTLPSHFFFAFSATWKSESLLTVSPTCVRFSHGLDFRSEKSSLA